MPTTDEDALRAIRAAETVLQQWWPEGESPRSWWGVTWSGDRVQELELRDSELEVLAPQIGQLTALTKLNLSYCEHLKELPPQIGQLTALTKLDLYGCEQLKELPPQIGQLLALTDLNVINCEQLTLAPGAKEGQSAQDIVAAYARLLIVAPHKGAPGELHSFLRANPLAVPAFFKHIVGDLTATGYGEAIAAWLSEAIKATPELANLTAPDGRSVTDAAEQARLSRATAKPDETALRAIRAASAALQKRWPEGMSPRSWGGFTWSGDRVQELELVSGLEVLPPQIGQLTALTKIGLNDCKQLKELPPQIGQLTALRILRLYNCKQLKELPPQIGQLTALTDLDLRGCEQLKELPPQIGQLLALTFLGLSGCDQLTLAPGAEKGQRAPTLVAAYAPLLIVEPHKDAPSELHAFLRANPLAIPAFFKAIITDAAHASWLGEAVTATPELAKLTAADGRRAIDVAVPACKQAMQAALFLLGRFDVDDGKLLHRSATAAVAAADDHGDPEAKPVPRVALKAMREVDQVRAELKGRAGLDPQYVIAIKAVYADKEAVDAGEWGTLERAAAGLQGVELQRVPGLSRSIRAHLFRSKKVMDQAPADAAPDAGRELKRGLTARTLDASSEYKLLIVLELADRNLKHTIDHEHIAGDDWPAIRYVASHLGRALDHVHAEGGIHADLKPLNAVGDGNTWKIIDFDVFCKVGEPFGNKVPSSGYCPPEMARVLLAATDQDTSLLTVETSLLKEYVASEAYDLWSFGVVLYHLCFGTPLWKTDINDNISLSDLRKLAAGSDAEPLRKVLNKALFNGERRDASIDLKVASALLRKLLEPNAQKRLAHFESKERSSMQGVLEEPFFQGQSLDAATLDKIVEKQEEMQRGQEEMQREQEKQTALLLTIKELSTENKTELRRTREVLMKGIFEATEVSKPTTFIVLNEELPEPTSEEEKKKLMSEIAEDGSGVTVTVGGLLSEIAEDGSGVTVTGELASVTFTEDGPRFEAVGKYKEYVDKFNTGMKWVHRLKTIGSNVAAGKVGEAFETIKAGLGDLVTGETMYLYLVDELTCEPVRAEGYPIEITKHKMEIVHELLPLMQVGLRAMSIYNGAGGIARLFGCPVPKVPEAWAKGARESVELLKQESSVAQFGVVHNEAMGGSEESKSVRGHSLRVFTDFLQEHDPGLKAGKSGDFAGLRRIGDPDDGTALWTTLTDPQEIKSALEARTREREAEAREGNKYIQQRAVEGLARQTTTVASQTTIVREDEKAAVPEVAPGAKANLWELLKRLMCIRD